MVHKQKLGSSWEDDDDDDDDDDTGEDGSTSCKTVE